jgi:hypothetical protein
MATETSGGPRADATPEGTTRALALIQETPEQRITLWTQAVAPGAKPELAALVWHYARVLQLDPLRREVMLITMDRKNDVGQWEKEHAVIINVHGLLKIVGRQSDYAGLASAVVYPGERCSIDADGVVHHEYDVAEREKLRQGQGPGGVAAVLPIGAWATVRRAMHGRVVNYTTWLPFAQVAQWKWADVWENGKRTGKKQRQLRAIWGKLPDWMNEKCAIAFSARKAYDHVIGRVYVPEEFGLESGKEASPEWADRVEVLDEGATPPAGTPSVAAGIVPGSERMKPLPENPDEYEEGGGEDAQAINDALADAAVQQEPDSLVSELRPDPALLAKVEAAEQPDLAAHGWVPAETSDDERSKELLGLLRTAASMFTRPPRLFVQDFGGDLWITDGQVIKAMGRSGPLQLARLRRDEIQQASEAVEAIIAAKREGKRGRERGAVAG